MVMKDMKSLQQEVTEATPWLRPFSKRPSTA